jgi:cell division protein FtsL
MHECKRTIDQNEPIQDFSHCHAGIIKHLDQLGALPALVEPAQRLRDIAVNALEFFRDVIFAHHQDEERERVQAMTRRLTQEHRELEATWRSLEADLKKLAKGQFARIDVAAIERLVVQYRAHAGFEEQVFMPLSQTILGRNASHLAALGLSLHMRRVPRRPATYV